MRHNWIWEGHDRWSIQSSMGMRHLCIRYESGRAEQVRSTSSCLSCLVEYDAGISADYLRLDDVAEYACQARIVDKDGPNILETRSCIYGALHCVSALLFEFICTLRLWSRQICVSYTVIEIWNVQCLPYMPQRPRLFEYSYVSNYFWTPAIG